MFQLEATQKRLPQMVHLYGGGRGGRIPQPQRFRGSGAGQSAHCSWMAVPSITGSGPLWPVQAPVRGSLGSDRSQGQACAVTDGVSDGGVHGDWPGRRISGHEPGSVPRCASATVGATCWRGKGQYPIRAQLHRHLGWEVGQQERQTGTVIAGITDDPDLGVAGAPMPGGDQRIHHSAQLAGGQIGAVVLRAYAQGAQQCGPERTAGSSVATKE